MSKQGRDGFVIALIVLALLCVLIALLNQISIEKMRLVATVENIKQQTLPVVTHTQVPNSQSYYKITCFNLDTGRVEIAVWSHTDLYFHEHEDLFSYFDVVQNDRISEMIHGIRCRIRPPITLVVDAD